MTYHDIYYGGRPTCHIYERGVQKITRQCETLLSDMGVDIVDTPEADFAVAPYLQKIIPEAELSNFKKGVLVFHPSLLPIYRGKTSIRDAFKNGDDYTGVTWFWANTGVDMGDICEQTVLKISGSPREFYEGAVIPAGVLLLELIIKDLFAGTERRRPQELSINSGVTVG